jgi:alkylhydroperoxidase family enzyme
MAHIPPPTPQTLDKFQAIWLSSTAANGFSPYGMQLLAHRPDTLLTFSLLFSSVFAPQKIYIWQSIKMTLYVVYYTLFVKKKQPQLPPELKHMLAFVASNEAQCAYCQAHTAHSAHLEGIPTAKLWALRNYASSPLFSDAEKTALSFAKAAAQQPSSVTTQHYQHLAQHYTQHQIVEIATIVSLFGFLNRWNAAVGSDLEPLPEQFSTHITPQ